MARTHTPPQGEGRHASDGAVSAQHTGVALAALETLIVLGLSMPWQLMGGLAIMLTLSASSRR